ncbi:Hypothetical predicted protein [Octopus vulgaris]|uniref:Uncharacterized protein n=1 Tax=Octopus vulgaris TaxID=6645 RepID=A0AA36AY53_OCTVU|nr:Hypothetical predicted protein [Octopus vulgaris]
MLMCTLVPVDLCAYQEDTSDMKDYGNLIRTDITPGKNEKSVDSNPALTFWIVVSSFEIQFAEGRHLLRLASQVTTETKLAQKPGFQPKFSIHVCYSD